ncbi:Regulator of sigma-E protease RseP [Lacunisphaera limnophila]|uniref:Zinc metalloprotease n=1 Tax=Lacunisphaera limnophila TaxID=1838286 RepID=A0A1D8B018_9BACT|nr:RIP metalloprotease RseP [Lacunisphaera limnophila]AOS46477.1 Regulator of sigma-E protease RseP [Lacunisphaera limnophila]
MPDFFNSLFSSVWAIFLIILFFGGSIFVHELGHFLAARRRGVKVSRFSIGFGPAIWKRTAKDGVEYRLAWIPLGGYVALPQLADMAAVEGESDIDVATLPPISYGTRMIVFGAGAFFNVLFAFALATILWVIGQPTSEDMATTRIGYITATMTMPDGSTVTSPAAEAGLRVGDAIRAIDGTQVADWPELLQTLVTSAGVTDDGRRRAVFTIERDGQLLDLPVYPRLSGEDNIRRVGILAAYTPIVAEVPEKSYAATLGLQVGDRLLELNGTPLLNLVPLMDAMQAKEPKAVVLKISRAGTESTITVPADRAKDTPPLFGAAYRTTFGLKHTNPITQITNQVAMTWRTLWSLLHPQSDIGISKLSGPIGIGKIYWDASEAGIRYVLWIAILVNVNLAIFNLLPIPVLDGGHMLFATIGKLRGRALPTNFIAATQSAFMILLLSMIIYVSVFDVRRIARDVKADHAAEKAAEEKPAK